MNSIKISAIITSGGNSIRFGSNKLLEKINGNSIIETTILKFLDLVDEIVIPCQDEIKNHILKSKFYCDKIKFAPAGQTRQKSVYNGILECSNPEIVLIHDGARPFVDKETIKQTIELTFDKKAVVVGKMAVDTIKYVVDKKVVKTLDRKTIFQAQTPQAFGYDLIKKIHQKYIDDINYTDDASMAETYGVEVYIIDNKKNNIKITTKDDLNIYNIS